MSDTESDLGLRVYAILIADEASIKVVEEPWRRVVTDGHTWYSIHGRDDKEFLRAYNYLKLRDRIGFHPSEPHLVRVVMPLSAYDPEARRKMDELSALAAGSVADLGGVQSDLIVINEQDKLEEPKN